MMWKRPFRLLAILVAGHLATGADAEDTAPDVVVSLKPIHSLVAGVMGGAGTPWLMVAGAASPHTYQLRFSEAQVLRDADLVVWIGKNLETFLHRPILNLGADAEVVTLHEAAGIRLLPNREGGIWDHEEEAEAHEDEEEGHGHEHSEFDMHLWLDPGNVERIVGVVAEALVRVDPARAETYRGNAQVMRQRIEGKVAEIRERLAPLRNRPFIVFHDGYQYFEHAFDLAGVGSVAVDPSRRPGARRLAELREALAEQNVVCVFTEPQFEPDLVQTIIEGSGARTAALDPLGIDVESGPDAWFEIMDGLADAFAKCLGDG